MTTGSTASPFTTPKVRTSQQGVSYLTPVPDDLSVGASLSEVMQLEDLAFGTVFHGNVGSAYVRSLLEVPSSVFSTPQRSELWEMLQEVVRGGGQIKFQTLLAEQERKSGANPWSLAEAASLPEEAANRIDRLKDRLANCAFSRQVMSTAESLRA